MLRHSPAVPCTERIRRPSDPMERRGKSRAWKDGTACIQFEISLQNEFSLEENIALARKFLLEQFVSRGMTVDVTGGF